MDGTLMKELAAMQCDMLVMEGMLEALVRGAYNGTSIEHIGNCLEILREYVGQRAEKLDSLIRIPEERRG